MSNRKTKRDRGSKILLKKLCKCGNCKQELRPGEGHYVPASLGEPGFYYCKNPDLIGDE